MVEQHGGTLPVELPSELPAPLYIHVPFGRLRFDTMTISRIGASIRSSSGARKTFSLPEKSQ